MEEHNHHHDGGRRCWMAENGAGWCSGSGAGTEIGVPCNKDGKAPDAYFESFPPGYRFQPTEQELIQHYLNKKLSNQQLPPNRIHQVDVYRFSPMELSGKYKLLEEREEEWYFFSSRRKKYKNGTRPDRAAGNGYWKPTGGKVDIIDHQNGNQIAQRRSLDFWEGKQRHPDAKKTSWKMHEYEVPSPGRKRTSDMLLDECLLVKIYNSKKSDNDNDDGDQQHPTDSVSALHSNQLPLHSNSDEHNSTNSVTELPSNHLPLPSLVPLAPANELYCLITDDRTMFSGSPTDVAGLRLEYESANHQYISTNQNSPFFNVDDPASDFGSSASYDSLPPDDLSIIVFPSNEVSSQTDKSRATTKKEESVRKNE